MVPPSVNFALARELCYPVAAERTNMRGWAAIVALCVPSLGLGLRPPPASPLYHFGGAAWEAMAERKIADHEIQMAGLAIEPELYKRAKFNVVKVSKAEVQETEDFSSGGARTSEQH